MSAPSKHRSDAHAVASYGMREVGGWGIRGWRVFCPGCSYLSRIYPGNGGCKIAAHKHRGECGVTA